MCPNLPVSEHAQIAQKLSELRGEKKVALIDAKWFSQWQDYISAYTPISQQLNQDQSPLESEEINKDFDLLQEIRMNKFKINDTDIQRQSVKDFWNYEKP